MTVAVQRAAPVVLDTSVLYPIVLCDTLLRLAERNLFRPRWTDTILEELNRNLSIRIGETGARRRIEAMSLAFPDAAVERYRHLIGDMPNHPNDRHVLAAAVAVRAPLIVTANLRHFPDDQIERVGVRALSPDAFLAMLLDTRPTAVERVVRAQIAEMRAPALTPQEMLALLGLHAPAFADRMRAALLGDA